MHENRSLEGRTVVITGANSGIGFAASKLMAAHSANVVMACRDEARGRAAAEAVREETENERVRWLPLDISSGDSIQCFVEEFLSRFDTLDGLIHNAASFDLSQKKPVESALGSEMVFSTNYLGPFLLTSLLLDVLKASAPARIINISSKGLAAHPFLKIQFEDLDTCHLRKYSPAFAYYHSKLALLMFTRELAKRLQEDEIQVNAVRVPNVQVDPSRLRVHPLLRKMYQVKRRFAMAPEQMAQAYLLLVADPEFGNVSGKYFDENCKEVDFPRFARDDEACLKLWDVTTELLEIDEFC